jgi:hypothetical protein
LRQGGAGDLGGPLRGALQPRDDYFSRCSRLSVRPGDDPICILYDYRLGSKRTHEHAGLKIISCQAVPGERDAKPLSGSA